MADDFDSSSRGLMSPAENAVAITPSDVADLPKTSRAIYVGGAGNLAVVTKRGDTVTFQNLGAGSVLSVRVARVLSTGTTATNLINLY